MILIDSLKAAKNSLLSRKSRSFLTMLGIIIGIGAVIIVMSVGAGAQSLIVNQIKGMGSNLIGVLPGASEEEGPPAAVMGLNITTLKYEDAEALTKKSNVPHAVAMAAYARGVGTVSWKGRSVDTNFVGTTAGYIQVEDTEVESGRFFSEDEEKGLGRVAVLGSQVKENLFGESEAIGERMKIKRENFRVIGVMKERGVEGFQNQDNQIFIPISSAQKLLLGINYINMIRVKVDSEENIDRTIEDIKYTLRAQHNISNPEDDDFTVRSMAQALDIFQNVTNSLKFFLVAIAALSLLVGGVGIMNIMLVTVSERTREIGLRKAVGAKNLNILMQFLLEAVVVTFIGGVLGIIGGSILSGMVAFIARYMGYSWDLVISIQSIVLACGVSALVGIIFGYFPARRAAHLDPITALRYE